MQSYILSIDTICLLFDLFYFFFFFFSSRRRHTRLQGDWSSDVCSSDLDGRVPGLKARVDQASGEIMAVCIAAGGTITGEHGIGLDKLRYMPLIFDGDALAAMRAVRLVFDPLERVNPGKVVPVHACREWSGVRSAQWGVRSAADRDRSSNSALRIPHSAFES